MACQHHAPKRYRYFVIAILLLSFFSLVEWWFSRVSGSLTLLSDAGHVASDAVAMGIALLAAWIANKPPSKQHSYGLGRAEVLAACLSSLLLFAIALSILYSALLRLASPTPVAPLPVIYVSLMGLVVNFAVGMVLIQGEKTLNLRAALLHVVSDWLGSLAGLISGLLIYFRGWTLADPLLSMAISGLILLSSLRLLRETLRVLMEGVPSHLDYAAVARVLAGQSGVISAHDIHVWSVASGKTMLSGHVVLSESAQWPLVLAGVHEKIRTEFGITHLTLQPEWGMVECVPCEAPDACITPGDVNA